MLTPFYIYRSQEERETEKKKKKKNEKNKKKKKKKKYTDRTRKDYSIFLKRFGSMNARTSSIVSLARAVWTIPESTCT